MPDCAFSPDVGNRPKGYLKIENMELPAKVGTTYGAIVLKALREVGTPGTYQWYDPSQGANQQTDTITMNRTLETAFYLRSNAPAASLNLLRQLEGNERRGCWHEGNATGAPSVDEPLRGGLLNVPAMNFGSADFGSAAEVPLTVNISGAVSCLEEPLPAPANLVTSTPAPTATTIDLDWDADTTYLTTHETYLTVRGYHVRYRIVGSGTWTTVADEVPNTGAGKIEYQLTGLTATSDYKIEVASVWAWGHVGIAATGTASTV